MGVSGKLSRDNRMYIIIILIAATVVTVLSTALTYRNAVNASEDSMKLQALGMAVSLEASLSKIGADSGNIFKTIISEGRWQGIAFLALYDKDGTTILHSNENLIGRQVQDSSIKAVAETESTVYEYIKLGTGENVFALNFPAHVQNSETILRVALHTYPFYGMVRQTRLQLISISILIACLWGIGFFFVRASKRSEELKLAMAEKERLAMLGEMASILAHEIRNPLGSIKGFAQYLIEQKIEDKKQRTDCLNVIVSESKRLERLTDDLLAYVRPAAVSPEEFNLRHFIDEVVMSAIPASDNNHAVNTTAVSNIKGIKMHIDIPENTKVTTDREKLKQILINIIQNAVDASDGNGDIEIKSSFYEKEITISVKDNGCGINRDTIEKIFQPFFTTKAKGTGLGLAIVQKLLKSIGGRIEVNSEHNSGTIFKITFARMLSDSWHARV
jgi:two-component system sensor histidine kinase HydH